MVEGQAHRKTLRGVLRMLAGCQRERRARGRLRRASVQGLLALTLGSIPGWVAAAPCAPWPGEPKPLPRVSDPDEMRARWATLRVRELERAARSLEETAPVRAHGFWRRVLCLDPANDEAVAGLTRTAPVAVHRPPVVVRPGEDVARGAWASLSEPVRVEPQRPPATPRRAPREEAFARALAEVETRVRAAQFEPALESAARARRAAEDLGDAADPERRAQLEVLAATAELALGRSDAAASSFGRALDADPDLELDAARTSPKVRRAFDRVRAARRAAAP